MEKRKAYIYTALVILLLITGLAFWYLYTAKQELAIGQVTDLELYGAGEQTGRPTAPNTNSNTTGFGTFGSGNNNLNQITQPKSLVTNTDLASTATEAEIDTEEPEVWRVQQISSTQTAGASVRNGVVVYTEKKTGNILKRNKGGTVRRISGSTIQHVQRTLQLTDDSLLLLRDNDEPALMVTLGATSATTTESQLTDEVLDITRNQRAPNGPYYITRDSSSNGVVVKSLQDTSIILWESPLTHWLLQETNTSVTVTQKASYGIPGYAYIFPQSGIISNQELIPLVQDAPGLITNTSPNSQQVLYSTVGKGGITLSIKNVATAQVTPLSIKTLASKCTWGNDNITFYCGVPSTIPGNLPDSWHKGQVHFTDSLWSINSVTGDAFELAQATGLDIIDLQEDVENGIILFKNKTDQSLWSVIRE